MVLFAVAHALRLEDGSYAVRSPEFPGCEARNAQVELAREQFGEALRERSLQMIQAGAAPPLYSYEELAPSFATRCTMQIPAPDRPQPVDVLHVDRAVQPELRPQILEVLAIRLLLQHELDDVAGDQAREREDDERGNEQRRSGDQQAAKNIVTHDGAGEPIGSRRTLPTGRSRRP